jgi:hypothetical protein
VTLGALRDSIHPIAANVPINGNAENGSITIDLGSQMVYQVIIYFLSIIDAH